MPTALKHKAAHQRSVQKGREKLNKHDDKIYKKLIDAVRFKHVDNHNQDIFHLIDPCPLKRWQKKPEERGVKNGKNRKIPPTQWSSRLSPDSQPL